MQATIHLGIQGMTCQGCAASIRKALRQLEGFGSADISVEEGRAAITFDDGLCSEAQLRQAIEDAGFDVT